MNDRNDGNNGRPVGATPVDVERMRPLGPMLRALAGVTDEMIQAERDAAEPIRAGETVIGTAPELVLAIASLRRQISPKAVAPEGAARTPDLMLAVARNAHRVNVLAAIEGHLAVEFLVDVGARAPMVGLRRGGVFVAVPPAPKVDRPSGPVLVDPRGNKLA